MNYASLTPSDRLLKEVRAALVLRGSSLSALADEMGVKRQNLTKALLGEWCGPKAEDVVLRATTVIAEVRGH